MRFSTTVSLLIAIILAFAAVFGARTWMGAERQELAESFQSQLEAEINATEAAAAEQIASERAAAERTAALLAQQRLPDPVERDFDTIVVASEPISTTDRIDQTSVREVEWAGDFRPDGSFATIEELISGSGDEDARYALVNISRGEPILASRISGAGQRVKLSTLLAPGMSAVSIQVDATRGVAGFVIPGDRVDVVIVAGRSADVLLQGIKVVAVDQLSSDQVEGAVVARTVTFEVSTQEAQKLILGAEIGSLSLTLREQTSTDITDYERITVADLYGLDAAEDLVASNMARVEADQAEERFASLEAMVLEMNDGVSEKFNEIEEQLAQPVVENTVANLPIVEPIIQSVRSTVAVIRNGQRAEYSVNRNSENQ
jgi:pilus assembly protein CpaB